MALYSFAGLTVSMSPSYPTLRSRAMPYLIPGDNVSPDITLALPPEFVSAVRAEHPLLSDDNIEYIFTGAFFHRRLLSYGGMMLHSSAVAAHGRAYLFTAPPGTGKSTHTAGWVRALGGDAFIINDDKPALRFPDGVLTAYGTPFSGSSPLNANAAVPVGGICVLRRGDRNSIRTISADEAVPLLYSQTVTTLSRADGVRFLDILTRVAASAPLYMLECTVGIDAVRCSYEFMTGHRLRETE